MKKQIKRFSKSTLAVVLTLCMLLSCVTVGIISTNAAQVDSDSTGANVFMHYSSTDTGFGTNPTNVGIDSTVTLGSVAKGAFYVSVDGNSYSATSDNWISSVDLGSNVYDDGTGENNNCKYRRLYFGKAMTNVKFTYSGGKLTVTTEPTYTITTSAGAGGSLSANMSRAAAGETVTLTITPERGKVLDALTVKDADNVDVSVSGSGNTRTFTMPAKNVTANATFTNAPSYTVTANQVSTGNGKIRIAISGAGSATATTGGSATLAAYSGETLTITASPERGYAIDTITVTNGDTTTTYTSNPPAITIGANVTVSATFKKGTSLDNEYDASPGSSITGNSNLYSGINATFYDYYTDDEVNGSWYTSIDGYEDAWIGGIRRRNPYTALNSALSEYAQQNSVQYPMYFGSFYVNGYQDPGYYHSSPGNPNWGEKINDSNSLGGNTKSLPGLAGLNINDGMIHYSASNTTANGADMVLFDKQWLTSRGTSDPDADKLKLVYNDTYNWSASNAKVYVGFRGSWPNEYWVEMTHDSTNKRYTAEIPSGWENNNVVFARINPSYSLETGNLSNAQANWNILDDSNKCWNKTGTGISRDGLTYTLTSWTAGTWSGSYNGPLASFVNTPFPVRKTTKNDATYYEFNSENATDNIYFDDLTGGSPVVQYGAGTTYGQKNGYDSGSGNQYGFYPFDKYTDQKRPGLDWTKDFGKDLAFGMKLEIKFTLGMNGQILAEDGVTKVSQVFDFSGDDDLWVYIDNELILDLGGDHCKTVGTIDFNTRTIEYVNSDTKLTNARNQSFASKIDNTNPKQLHTMTLYYLERGMHESNLKFGFSFNPLTDEVELEKEVKVDAVNEGLQAQVAAADDFDFTFVDSTDSSKGKNTSYTLHNATTKELLDPSTGTTSDTGVLSGLKDNQYAEIKKGFNVKDIISITESDPNTANGLQYKTSYKIIDEEVDTSVMSNEITHGTGLSTGNFPYDTIVPDANPYINLTHMRAIFTNEVETKNLTITKEISNKYDPDAQFPITVGISVGGNALNTNSLQFYRDGSSTAETFSGGKAYIKQGEEIEIPGIPKGAKVTVSETTPMPANYSFVSIDNDAHSVNGTINTNGYKLNTDDYVTIVNKIAENGLIITKALDNDVVDYGTAFKIKIERSDDNGATYTQVTDTLKYTHYEWNTSSSSYVPVTETLAATGANNEYQIHSGCQLVIPNLPVGTKIRVIETDFASDYYEYNDMTIEGGATLLKDNANRTGIVTMGSSAATLTIKNKAIRETIIITKTTDYDQDNSLFGIKVEMKQRNSNGNRVPNNNGTYKVLGTDTTWLDHNNADGNGTYNIKKTGQIKFENVPRGTYVQITEPFIGNSPVTGNQRFTANFVHVTNSTGATEGTNYLNTNWQCIASTPGGQVNVEVNNKVMKNNVIITKNIVDADDTDTEHTITVTITKDSGDKGGSAYDNMTYTSSKNGEQTVANGSAISIVENETLTFSRYPVGTHFTVSETAAGTNYEFDSFTAQTVADKTVDGSTITFKTTDTSGGDNVTVNNKLGMRNLTIKKLVDNYTTSDKFTITIETKLGEGNWTPLANTAFTSDKTERTDLTTDAQGKTTISQDETLTLAVKVGSQVRITETVPAGYDDDKTDLFDAVKHGTTTPPTSTSTDQNWLSFVIDDADVDVTITNSLQTYNYVIKYIYEAYSATTYTSKTEKDPAHRVTGEPRSYTQRGEITQADLDTYFKIDPTTKEITFRDATARKNFINKFAPYEDDFMMGIEWSDKNPKSADYSDGTISLETTGESMPNREVKAYFMLPYEVDGNLAATSTTKLPAEVKDPVMTTQYGNWVTTNGEYQDEEAAAFVTAPRELTSGGTTYYFQYWQITFVTGSDEQHDKVENNTKKCYFDKFNMTLYQDSYIEPIYKSAAEGGSTSFRPSDASYEDTKGGEATISFIETSRSSWNEDGAPDQSTDAKKKAGDRVYSDFLLTFGYKDKQLNSGNGTIDGVDVKIGFVLERVAELDKVGDKYVTKSQAEYKTAYDNGIDDNKVINYINGATVDNFLLKDNIAFSTLDNKNQMKYSLDMKNKEFSTLAEPTSPYRNYVYRAYTYTKIGDDNVVVSTPVYFTIYDIASIENGTV